MAIDIENVLRTEANGRVYYNGWVKASDAYDAVYVPVTKTTKIPAKAKKSYVEALEERGGGYQRCATRSRQHSIAKYLISNPTSVLPPVLLSDRGKWKWVSGSSDRIGRLIIEEKAAVVDGQHRLGGVRLQATMEGGDPARLVPFVVVVGLSEVEEKTEFLTINNTQKGVSKAHTAFLESDKWWNAVALALNESGPFEGRIQAAGGVRETWHTDLKLHSVANAIHDTFRPPAKKSDVEVWGFADDDERKDNLPELVNRYWELISEVFADEWSDMDRLPLPDHLGGGGGSETTRNFEYKLLELTGFLAWMWFFQKIAIDIWNSSSQSLNEEALLRYLTWIREKEEPNPSYGKNENEPEFRKAVDWRKKGKFEGRTGGAGARAIVEEMVRVYQAFKDQGG